MSEIDVYRVMVTDDSAVIRGLITRILEADPAIKVVGSASDGRMAVNTMKRLAGEGTPVDAMVLDIEMPGMDGLAAIPRLLEADPHLKIIMASTLTLQNASASLRALALGASDYVPKPTSTGAINGTDAFKRELVQKVKTLGGIGRDARRETRPTAQGAGRVPAPAAGVRSAPAAPKLSNANRTTPSRAIALRRGIELPPAVIVIGSSTGGPQALSVLLDKLPADLGLPILITQHMPPTFTTILAQHLAKSSGVPAAEAVDGEPVRGGRIYVAPGDFHMVPVAEPDGVRLRLTKEAPENFCRPSVDPMFRGAAQVWGGRVAGIVLTGMGQDGLAGGQALVEAGGTLLAQDEKTSVVWGMPGAVAMGGLCTAVLPLPDLARWLRLRLGRTS